MNAKSSASDNSKKGGAPGQDSREDRLKAALKANLARRKQQARVRKASPDEEQKE